MKEIKILIQVNPGSSVPIYSQIIEQIKYLIASASIKVGDVLPSVRELALQLKVNPNTIVKAYKELEHEGILEIKHGSGAFVTEKIQAMRKNERKNIIMENIDKLVSQAIHLDINEDELRKIVSDRYREYKNRRK